MDMITFGLNFGVLTSGIILYKLLTSPDSIVDETKDEIAITENKEKVKNKVYKPMSCRKFLNKCEKFESDSKKSIL